MPSLVFGSEPGVDECVHRLSAPLSVVRGEEFLDRLAGLIGGHDEREGRGPLHEFRFV